MSGFKTFAIAGVGNVGAPIAKELIKKGLKVVGLTRKGSNKALPEGVIVREIDYEDHASLVDALQGVEVVISTISTLEGFPLQIKLADAAKSVGVQLFVPSEFGHSTLDPDEENGPFVSKRHLQRHLKEIGLPYALFFTGGFTDQVITPFFGFDIPNRTVRIVGEGKGKIGWVTRPDVARYVAYVLTQLPKSQLENAVFSIEGDRKSLREIVSIIEKVHGITITVDRADFEQIKAEVYPSPKSFAQFADYFRVKWELGKGAGDPLTNNLYPGWNPEDFETALKKYY